MSKDRVEIERKNVILSAMQSYDVLSDKPEKAKEIELRKYPFMLTLDDAVELTAACMHGEAAAIKNGGSAGAVIFPRIKADLISQLSSTDPNTRQSPQINIDELTRVIEREITRFVPNAKDKFSDVLAQAITSHLNGKGK